MTEKWLAKRLLDFHYFRLQAPPTCIMSPVTDIKFYLPSRKRAHRSHDKKQKLVRILIHVPSFKPQFTNELI